MKKIMNFYGLKSGRDINVNDIRLIIIFTITIDFILYIFKE